MIIRLKRALDRLARLGDRIGGDSDESSTTTPASTRADAGNRVWRDMLEALPDAAIVLDGERRIVAANPAARALFPADPGKHLVAVDRTPDLVAAVDAAVATGGIHRFRMRTRPPIEHHLEGTVARLGEGASGAESPAMLIVLHDRTEAEQLAQMRADFVANASHELRTPLTSLSGFIETLQGPAHDDAGARERFLGIMQQEATRMSRLIEDLLSLSRIEMHEHVRPSGTVDLVRVVGDTIDQLGSLAARHNTTVHLAAPQDAPLIVVGDRNELMQVTQNIIQNAIKYGRPGGKVGISLGRVGDRVELAVRDDGIGIAPQHLPRLTERFYRVNAKESRERGGTGLGLAIVKHIVNRHRGDLRISSELGSGSEFVVSLPAAG